MIRDTLLVIDDSELDLAILNEIFKNLFQVVCLSDAHQGLSFLKQNRERICAVLLDICLGRRGVGFAVLYQLQVEQTTSDLPVILITTDANEKDVRASVERGAVDFLVKPVDPHAVQERVCAVVRKAWPEGSTILDHPQEEETQKEGEARSFFQDLTLEEARHLSKCWLDTLCRFCRYRPELSIDAYRQLGKLAGALAHVYVEQHPDGPLTQEEAELIGLAAPFCDIGRLGLPVGEGEEEDLTRHTDLGWELFSQEGDIPFFRCAAEIARWHHKNADGSGWPPEEDTAPLSAQIVRLALRIQHYLHYYQGYPDRLDRVIRTLASEVGSVVTQEVYQTLEEGRQAIQAALAECPSD